MTRINADIEVEKLCDQHLMAETREILRLRHLTTSKSKVTPTFRLGTGHVLFFKDKLKFAHQRYTLLHNECKKRGFNVQKLDNGFDNIPTQYYNDWKPTKQDNQLIVDRISERLNSMKSIRYYGKPITAKEAIKLLK